MAADLKTRYLSATKVVHRPMGTRKRLVPKDLDIRPVKDSELIYLQSSPDFCMKNEKVGSHGTQERFPAQARAHTVGQASVGIWGMESLPGRMLSGGVGSQRPGGELLGEAVVHLTHAGAPWEWRLVRGPYLTCPLVTETDGKRQ